MCAYVKNGFHRAFFAGLLPPILRQPYSATKDHIHVLYLVWGYDRRMLYRDKIQIHVRQSSILVVYYCTACVLEKRSLTLATEKHV